MPLCLTFINLKKAFDSFETEVITEALGNQGVPTQSTQCVRMLHKLYNNFTIGISPFCKEVIIIVKRRARQGDTISPKLFCAALENVISNSKAWE
uniref:Reverse transcriptase domain-containing protein n=1 Tax=Haemonchus contortus TaxID=6289 RepID=A0A7I4XS12_HAECO